ncbi:MAG: DoxX family protein [Methylobacteriaceae bacterium]|nr:DoxX family protein [Rhodoblastus sp.]MCC0005098.1 DoxX family protein [Methylobacteriaceae bacterium]
MSVTATQSSTLKSLLGPAVAPRPFDLAQPLNVIRIVAGLFYLPHILFKVFGMAGALGFFAKAGLVPAPFFVGLALVVETIACVALTFGLYLRWTGLLSAGCMAVAAYAVFATKGAGWLWNLGGVEYLTMWAVISLAIAYNAWKQAARA